LDKEMMLKIAREFGFSETAFVQKTSKSSTYTIRYFSPKKEIPLCGHATLAAAKVLFKDTDLNEIYFVTSENLVLVIKKRNEEIMMEFPVYDTVAATIPPATLATLGLEKVINTVYSPKNKIIVLEISDSQLLAFWLQQGLPTKSTTFITAIFGLGQEQTKILLLAAYKHFSQNIGREYLIKKK
jgi:predicted PhzF superfamily epimerase YddE/YHI9